MGQIVIIIMGNMLVTPLILWVILHPKRQEMLSIMWVKI